jgi:hypothetical protein
MDRAMNSETANGRQGDTAQEEQRIETKRQTNRE